MTDPDIVGSTGHVKTFRFSDTHDVLVGNLLIGVFTLVYAGSEILSDGGGAVIVTTIGLLVIVLRLFFLPRQPSEISIDLVAGQADISFNSRFVTDQHFRLNDLIGLKTDLKVSRFSKAVITLKFSNRPDVRLLFYPDVHKNGFFSILWKEEIPPEVVAVADYLRSAIPNHPV